MSSLQDSIAYKGKRVVFKNMALYALGDMHLSYMAHKPMDKFGKVWKNHEEKIEQSVSYTEEDTTTPIREVTLSFCGTGNISSTTEITPVDDNVFVSNVAGIIGKPFQFTSSSVFETAEVSFYVDTNCLDEVTFDNLGVL